MKKFLFLLFVLASFSASAQTLFYYGNDSVSLKDFLMAFKKNNPGQTNEKAFKEYLDLYIASRLKIKEASARGYDTLPQFIADLDNLRAQIMPSYMNDKSETDKLVNEAFTRSQKDIHLSHIFISFTQNGLYDTLASKKKAEDVLKDLKLNASFAEVAKKYSDDPSAKKNGGDLGWLTVFSLPYELENLAYSTPAGKTSALVKSKAGYHIFKNISERKALGRIKAAQILLAFPPDANAAGKEATKKLADSLYNRLLKGDDFANLATAFSNDIISAAANGQMQEFGVGQYEPAFENVAFSLSKDGIISKPFLTVHGYHVVKRLSRVPVSSAKDEKTMQALREKVEGSDRMQSVKKALVQKVLQGASFKKMFFNEAELWLYSDSVLERKPITRTISLNKKTQLFQLGKKQVSVEDWINYPLVYRYKADGSGVKPYGQMWEEFIDKTATDYYGANLEDFNEAFRRQIGEFKDGNLFFEIMQKQIWEPAQTDTIALKSFYENNKVKYQWKNSADAVIFYATDMNTAATFLKELKIVPADWNNLLKNFSEKIAADSARFDLAQIPGITAQLKAGVFTTQQVNKSDNSVAFAYIIKTYNKPSQKSFAEARGAVITDYQAELEKTWMQELKKKYPLRMNAKVVDDVARNYKFS